MNDLTPLEIARIVEIGEAEAYVDMFAVATPELGASVQRLESTLLLMMSDVPVTLFNRALCVGLVEPASESLLSEIENRYRQAHVKTFAVPIGSVFQPPDLSDWLATHYFVNGGNWAKMIRRPDSFVEVPTSLRVEQITPDRALDFAAVVIPSYGMPPILGPWLAALVGREGWQHFVAYNDDTPAAAGASYLRDGVAWLGIDGTLPAFRKRGGQGAIMAARIRAAYEAGCQWVVIETGEDTPENPNPSYHNMVRTGFMLAYKRTNYIFQAKR